MTSAPSPLYPPIAPYDIGMLKLDDTHEMYYEQSGNPKGVPVIFLHGGPGAGSSARHRQFFDPAHYRIIVYDQRGAGKSLPAATLDNNTTAHLIDDINALRAHVGVGKCHVFGGSWGSTLALAYAIAHPENVISLTLRGIFLMTAREIDWFLTGMGTIFPEARDAFMKGVPYTAAADILRHYYARLTGPDAALQLSAAREWTIYETHCCMLSPPLEMIEAIRASTIAPAIARIEAHYFVNCRFKTDNYLLDNIRTIRHIPCSIVQGRYDVVCPIETAHALHTAWPEARYTVVPDAGHYAFEPGIARALVQTMDDFRALAA